MGLQLSPELARLLGRPLTKDTRRSASTGRQSRAGGERAEELVLEACAFYRRTGRALVTKRPTPIRPIGKVRADGQFMAVFEGKAGCDFSGCLAGGRALLMELKSTTEPRLALERHGEATLKPGQAEELDQVDRLGGLALVVVRLAGGWWCLTWKAWKEALAAAGAQGRKSLGEDLLNAHGRRCGTLPTGAPDWL